MTDGSSLPATSGSHGAHGLAALHEAVLASVSDGVLVVGSDGRVQFGNASAERMLFRVGGDLLGMRLGDFLCQEDPLAEWASHPLAAPPTGAAPLHRESDLFLRLGGSSFPVAYTATPVDIEGRGVSGWLLVFQDITERKRVEKLGQDAGYDILTGLPNRPMFLDYLDRALSRADRGKRHLALLVVHLEGLAAVNDTLGSAVRDHLMQAAAWRLAGNVRAGDLLSRLQGEEFSIIVEDSRPAHLCTIAEKVIRVIEVPYDLGGAMAQLSASIGIALFPQSGRDSRTILAKADTAMREVKKAGKKGYRFSEFLKEARPGENFIPF